MAQTETEEVEVNDQLASQDYECDWCDHTIHDETVYVRVAFVSPTSARPRRTRRIEKYHPECFRLTKWWG